MLIATRLLISFLRIFPSQSQLQKKVWTQIPSLIRSIFGSQYCLISTFNCAVFWKIRWKQSPHHHWQKKKILILTPSTIGDFLWKILISIFSDCTRSLWWWKKQICYGDNLKFNVINPDMPEGKLFSIIKI